MSFGTQRVMKARGGSFRISPVRSGTVTTKFRENSPARRSRAIDNLEDGDLEENLDRPTAKTRERIDDATSEFNKNLVTTPSSKPFISSSADQPLVDELRKLRGTHGAGPRSSRYDPERTDELMREERARQRRAGFLSPFVTGLQSSRMA